MNIYSITGRCQITSTYPMTRSYLLLMTKWQWAGLSPKRSLKRRSPKSKRLLNITDWNHRQKAWFSVQGILRGVRGLLSLSLLTQTRIAREVRLSPTWSLSKKIFLTARIIWEDNLNSSNKSQTRSLKIKSLSIQMLLSKNKFLKFRSNKNSTTVPKSIDNWSWLI